MARTTNKSKDATEVYLASLGVQVEDIPDAQAVTSVSYTGQDAMAWQGETYERLSPEFEFYRATSQHGGVSIKAAKAEGYVALPSGSHDARMVGCHTPDSEVIMIRKRSTGDAVRADRERARQARRSRKVDASGTVIDGSRHEFHVRHND